MKVVIKLIFIFLSFLFSVSVSAETKISCEKIETIPKIKDVNNLTLERLNLTNKCLIKYAEIKIKELKKPTKGSEIIEFVFYNLKKNAVYKDIGNTFLSNLDKEEVQQLYEISVKNFPETTFLFWFFHHNKDETLIKTFKNYYKINKLAGLYVAKFLLEYRYDEKIKEFKKQIEPTLGEIDFNFFLIENLKTTSLTLKKEICEYYLFFGKHKPSADKVLKIVEQKFNSGDKSFHSCLVKHYIYQKRDTKKMEELLNQTNIYHEIYPELFFNYLHLKPQNKIDKKEFREVFKALIKSDYDKYVYASFIKHFYPEFIQMPKIDKSISSKIDDCIFTKFSCLDKTLDTLVVDKLIKGMRDIYFITTTLDYDGKKILNYYDQIIKNSNLTIFQKAFIFDQLEINDIQFKKKNRDSLRKFIFQNQTDLWIKNAKEISKSEELSEQIKVLYTQDLMGIFKLDIEKANEITLSPWFQKAFKQIPHATSNNYFALMNKWLMHTYMSDFKDKGSIYANQLSKRWIKINPKKLGDPIHLDTLWLLALLDEENSYTHLTLGAELSKNNFNKYDTFRDLKSRFFIQQGNYELANKLALDSLQYLEKKVLTSDLKKIIANKSKHSNLKINDGLSIGRLCKATMLISQTNRNLDFSKEGMKILNRYCNPFFDYLLDEMPIFALEYIGERLLYEILLIDLRKINYFSSDTINGAVKILKKEDIPNDLKYVISFYLAHYEKHAKFLVNKINIIKLIKSYNEQNIKNKFVVDKFWVFTKNLKIARDVFSDKKIREDRKESFIKITAASVYQAIDNLNERFNISYITSSKGLINNPVVLKNLINDYLAIKKTGYFNEVFDEKFYEIYNLLKIDQPEKLILNRLNKDNFSNEKTYDLTRRKFLIDTLVYDEFDSKERKELVKELSFIQRKIRETKRTKSENVKFLTINNIQDKLKSDEVYLNYLTNASSNQIALYAISKGDYNIHLIKDLKTIKDKITNLKSNLNKKINSDFVNDGYYLYEKLLKPFIKNKTKKVIISPHSFLYGLPFHALSTKPKTEKKLLNYILDEKNEWFGLKQQIVIRTNLSVNTKNVESDKSYTFFGVGNAIFSGKKNVTDEIKLGLINTRKRGIQLAEKKFPQLVETQNEIEAISRLPIFSKSTLLFKNNATEKNIKNSKEISYAKVISFATHGLAYGEMNRHSEPGLLMTTDNKDNGYLSMSEIAKLDLSAELVILSACNTGSSGSLNSSPFSGLATSFLAAGSQRVLASHWSVDDKSTSLLMQEILKAKFDSTISWSEAHSIGIKNFISKHKKYQSPYYWASFIIFEK